MTVLELQRVLVEEMKRITAEMLFETKEGTGKRLNIFRQSLPMADFRKQEDKESLFPYCIVRVEDGSTKDAMSPQYVRVLFIIGLYNKNRDRNGYERILTIIQRFQERFYKNPALGPFVMRDEEGRQEIEWTLQDIEEEDTYPYYYGGIAATWCVPSIRREDEFV